MTGQRAKGRVYVYRDPEQWSLEVNIPGHPFDPDSAD